MILDDNFYENGGDDDDDYGGLEQHYPRVILEDICNEKGVR